MSQLVIGAAYTYTAEDVWPFVSTLRRVYDGKIAFIVAQSPDPSLCDLCQQQGIDFFMVEGDVNNPIHMQWARFGHYSSIIDHPFFSECSKIFMCDIRDVIFQQDPFVLPLTTDLEFFTEPERIVNSYVNKSWLQDKYGLSTTHSFEQKNIICSGTIRATRNGAKDIIEKMSVESKRLQTLGLRPLDQPQLNYLVYSDKVHNYRIFDNGQGLVSTMHFEKCLRLTPDGHLLNNDGTLTPVIHQWDRTGAVKTVFQLQWTPYSE